MQCESLSEKVLHEKGTLVGHGLLKDLPRVKIVVVAIGCGDEKAQADLAYSLHLGILSYSSSSCVIQRGRVPHPLEHRRGSGDSPVRLTFPRLQSSIQRQREIHSGQKATLGSAHPNLKTVR
jgi:hypothetical protein